MREDGEGRDEEGRVKLREESYEACHLSIKDLILATFLLKSSTLSARPL